MAAILAAGYAMGAAVEALGAVLAPLGLSRRAVRAAYRLLKYAKPPPGPGGGLAGRAVRRSAPVYRALYLVASVRRLSAGMDSDDPHAAVRRERRYLKQHIAAQRRRAEAARQTDEVGEFSRRAGAGRVFRWLYVSEPGTPCVPIGGRTCRDLDGTVWPVHAPPNGTFPGMRHWGCKCRAIIVQTSQ